MAKKKDYGVVLSCRVPKRVKRLFAAQARCRKLTMAAHLLHLVEATTGVAA